MPDIRIKDLPLNPTPTKTLFIPTDLATAQRSTIEQIVLAGRPTASQAEAEAGTDPTKAMVPLTTKQAIAAYFSGLPTSMPSNVGDLWWNGGVLSRVEP